MITNNRSDLHYVPYLTLAPHNGFFPELAVKSGRKLAIGRKPEDDLTPLMVDFFAYNSRVVSRIHAEVWFVSGSFYIRDLKSTSGTFLNAMRLSEQGKERWAETDFLLFSSQKTQFFFLINFSRPFKIVTGDVVQFGVDLRNSGKEEEKCVSTVVIVRKVPLGLKQLSIRVVRSNWHLYNDQQLEKLPLSLEKEVLNVYLP